MPRKRSPHAAFVFAVSFVGGVLLKSRCCPRFCTALVEAHFLAVVDTTRFPQHICWSAAVVIALPSAIPARVFIQLAARPEITQAAIHACLATLSVRSRNSRPCDGDKYNKKRGSFPHLSLPRRIQVFR